MGNYDDDEPIQAYSENITSGPGHQVNQFKVGLVQVKIDCQQEVTNQKTEIPVLIELTGTGNGRGRLGADIVTVVDVSGSMDQNNKLNKLKRAMMFLIRKLGPNDRLSVVKFSTADDTERLCELRQMCPAAKDDIEELVEGLETKTSTDMEAGLEMGLDILAGRRFTVGRAKAIMFMSDGHQNEGREVELIAPGDVPIHTFGFGSGSDYNPLILEGVAKNSTNGTFSYAEVTDSESSNLSTIFSQCLGGLLSVVLENLEVTIQPVEDIVNDMVIKSKIGKVSAGDYLQTRNSDGSVTISCGNLYQQEVRKIVVDVSLPDVKTNKPVGTKFIRVRHSYKFQGRVIELRPSVITVRRTKEPISRFLTPLQAEIVRLETLDIIKASVNFAEVNKFDEATKLLTDTRHSLENTKFDEPNFVIESLKQEVDQLLKYMENKQVYAIKGRPFAMCTRISHERQRFAAKGDDVKNIRCFATPRMDSFLEQAEEFEKNPESEEVWSIEEDESEEAAQDPLGNIAPSIVQYLEDAIEALNNIKLLVSHSRGRKL